MISLKWLNDYVAIEKEDPKVMAECITRTGINVEKILTHHIPLLTVGYVLECNDHPDSDHLHVCQVDLKEEVVQIVCGAPNVAAKQKVIVARPGCILPGNVEIKKSVIRGQESAGMICALCELGLESKEKNYHKGIHVLPEETPVGSDPFQALGLDDVLYDLDLNPNRFDCNNHITFAYEVGATLDKEVTLPDTSTHPIEKKVTDVMNIEVETENCMMYRARMVEGLVIKESPDFIKERLQAAGMRPINNVVDISNYVMLEYGQPLHFFDQEALGNHIVVRMANQGEETVTLDQCHRVLSNEDIVITDGKEVVAVAGVMGGLSTEVTAKTTKLLIESALFDPYHIRYTSIRLGLKSEASARYEHGLNFEYTKEALDRACHLLEQYASAKVYEGEVVYDAVDKTPKVVEVTLEKINRVLGITLTNQDVLDAFRRLSFPVTEKNGTYTVTIRHRRLDVTMREDLIEEVGRLYGFDKIESSLPVGPIRKGEYTGTTKFRKEVSKYLRGYGLSEVRTYTLVSEEEAKHFRYQFGTTIRLSKPMSQDKSYVRQSLLASLIKAVDYNLAHSVEEIAIYEIANCYQEENNYEEKTKLAFALKGIVLDNPWQKNAVPYDFYYVKGLVESLLDHLGLKNRYRFVKNDALPEEMHPGVSAEVLVDNEPIGFFGAVHPMYHKEKIFCGELNLTALATKKVRGIHFVEPSRYPSITKDMAFVVKQEVTAGEILHTMEKAGGKLLRNIEIFDVYTGENVGPDEKSLAFSLMFLDPTRTLTEEEVMTSFNHIIDEVTKKHHAILRDK